MKNGWMLLSLVFANVLAGTVTIPVIRPLMAAIGAPEAWMHAFVGANMLGAAIGAPLLAIGSDRTGTRRPLVVLLSLLDAALLLACTFPLPLSLLLALRAGQGAASVGALSILMSEMASVRSASGHDSGAARSGAAVVLAIALGPASGALLLRLGGLYAPFGVAALCALWVGIVASQLPQAQNVARAPRAGFGAVFRAAPDLWVPTLWISAERFSVGCFVVTFSLFAHNVLGVSDARVGSLLSCFMLPFACTMGPIGKLVSSLGRPAVLAIGGVVYAGAFLLLGHTNHTSVIALLVVMGTASAAVYAPSLCLNASLAPSALRATAMAVGNAGGTLGMLLGTVTAGSITSVLRARGMESAEIYLWIFRAAAAGPLLALLVSASALLRLTRAAAPVATLNKDLA